MQLFHRTDLLSVGVTIRIIEDFLRQYKVASSYKYLTFISVVLSFCTAYRIKDAAEVK